MDAVSIEDAKTQFPRLIAGAEAGEEMTPGDVTDHVISQE